MMEARADVVLRTIDTRLDDPRIEGDRLITRTVRDIQTHWHVTRPSGMIMQTGAITIRGKQGTVSRWITKPDEDGTAYGTTWTTEGVLVDGKEYKQIADLNWNPENRERQQA